MKEFSEINNMSNDVLSKLMAKGIIPEGGIIKPNTSHIKNKYIDVAYAKQSETQKIDIYLPNNLNRIYPTLLYIHGGGFMLVSCNT